MADELNSQLLNLTADIVTAHLANNTVAAGDVPTVIQTVHAALAGLGTEKAADQPAPEPAVPVRSSVKPDYIVCLEDGKKLKMLKRHLMAHYNMTPAEYRAKWNLPPTYPMVAPNYAETRRSIAKTAGLGRKPSAAPASKSAPASKVAVAEKPAESKPARAKSAAPAKAPTPAKPEKAAKPAAKAAPKRPAKASAPAKLAQSEPWATRRVAAAFVRL